MYIDDKIWIAQGEQPVYLLPKMANRHGLIAGATGTGKTTTLKAMAESFSAMGVPVFLADIKGDLAGLAVAGSDNPKTLERLKLLGIEKHNYHSFPVRFWDLFGEGGHPVRTTVSEMGPLLISRLLGLSDAQEGVLNIIFRIADDRGMLLLDLKDLRAMVRYVGDHAKEFAFDYGNIAPQSAGAIQRSLLSLEDQGGEYFFGEPALDIFDWMKTDTDGRGFINVLHCVRLFQMPALYSTFLLWMLSELFEALPEAGDTDKPKLVFFFDEAHLLFDEAPKALLNKVEQVVRLIRSKGVGVYFITQNPADLPPDVLGQLGNRVQHALRGFTPVEQRQIRAAAETFRPNPKLDTETVLTELATGEALVSCLDADGRPGIVERGYIVTPQSMFGTIDDSLRAQLIAASPMNGKYNREIDRESAYEILTAKYKQEMAAQQAQQAAVQQQKELELQRKEYERQQKEQARLQRERDAAARRANGGTSRRSRSSLEKMGNTALHTIGRELGRSVARGLFGSLKW